VIERPTLVEQMQALPVGRWLHLPREFQTQNQVQDLIDRFGGGVAWVMQENHFASRRVRFQIRRAGEGDE
jgi:hypothetical protein